MLKSYPANYLTPKPGVSYTSENDAPNRIFSIGDMVFVAAYFALTGETGNFFSVNEEIASEVITACQVTSQDGKGYGILIHPSAEMGFYADVKIPAGKYSLTAFYKKK